jgi:hypothetical protein
MFGQLKWLDWMAKLRQAQNIPYSEDGTNPDQWF